MGKIVTLFPLIRMPSLRAWASPRLEQLPTSKYFFCRGDQASTSMLFTSDPPGHRSSIPACEPVFPWSGTAHHRIAAIACGTSPCCPRACRPQSSPAFQTDGSGRRPVPQCHVPTFLPEAGGITGERLGHLLFRQDCVDKLPIMECSLVPIRYRSSPPILYIMFSFRQSSSPRSPHRCGS